MMRHNLALLLDQSFANSHKKQILWLLALMVVVITALLGISYLPGMYCESEMNEHSHRFTDILFLLFDPGSMSDRMSSFYVVLVALVGMIVFCGMFISVITNSLETRTELYLSGGLRYKMQDHIVIIGYDDTVPALIHSFFTRGSYSHRYFLIQTSHAVPNVRQRLTTKLTHAEEKQVVIYSGELTLEEDLLALQMDRCHEVYVIGNDNVEARDAMNMDCLQKIVKILSSTSTLLPCHVQFKDPELFSLLQYSDLSKEMSQSIRFLPYNYENVWAQRVFVTSNKYIPIEGYSGIQANSQQRVQVIFCGMNAMAIEMAKQVAHIAHYPNFRDDFTKNRTTITFIDADANHQMLHFRKSLEGMFSLARYRYINAAEMPDIASAAWDDPALEGSTRYLAPNFVDIQWEFIQGTLDDIPIRTYLKQLAMDDTLQLSIVLPDECSETALRMATTLPYNLYTSRNVLQILVRQDENNAIVGLLSSSQGAKFAKLKSFGQLEDFFEEEVVPESLGKLVNACYDSSIQNREQCEQAWQKTPVANRWSSIHCANMRFTRLRMLGLEPQSLSNKEGLASMIESHIDDMARVEHNRWVVEKLLMGYRPLTEEEEKNILEMTNPSDRKKRKKMLQNAPYFAHLDICSLEHLKEVDPDTLISDKDVILALPDMLYS